MITSKENWDNDKKETIAIANKIKKEKETLKETIIIVIKTDRKWINRVVNKIQILLDKMWSGFMINDFEILREQLEELEK